MATFLNGDLHVEVYVSQTHGFVHKGQEKKVVQVEDVFVWFETSPPCLV